MQARRWFRGAGCWVTVVIATCLSSAPAGAVVTEAELAQYEQQREAPLLANLKQLAPDAVSGYQDAVAAMAKRDWVAAERLLAHVHHEAPGFTAATRRLCQVEDALKKRDRALALCREAAGDGSSRSLATLSYVLSGSGDFDFVASPEARAEALDLAQRAVNKDPQDVWAQRAQCLAAFRAGNPEAMRRCTVALERLDTEQSASRMWLERGRLLLSIHRQVSEPNPVKLDESAYAARKAAKIRPEWPEPSFLLAEIAIVRNDSKSLNAALAELTKHAPQDPRTYYYDALVGLAEGDSSRARASLSKAREHGLDQDKASQLESQIDAAGPLPTSKDAKWIGIAAGAVAVLWLLKRQLRRREQAKGGA